MELQISNAELAISLKHLADSVDSLKETVQELRDAMNKGRGALWIMMLMSSLAGVGLAKAISKIFGAGS